MNKIDLWTVPAGATEDPCSLRPPTSIVPAEVCLSVNETIGLVEYGAGSWSFLLGEH